MDNFKWMIDNDYKAEWIVDSLPSGYRITVENFARLSMF